ncbi:hypothetical protein V6N12_007900 [Hibiscus sabdariffa]|uniref:Uncharacterized protein n=1 Tax=Hibiscus sabdariffa TaxID=183260 RepID=A0ABR2A2D1_9ROSI
MDRKGRATKKGNTSSVIPEDNSGAIQILKHNTRIKSGEHRAVTVIEHEENGSSRDTRDEHCRKLAPGKGKIDITCKSVHVTRVCEQQVMYQSEISLRD